MCKIKSIKQTILIIIIIIIIIITTSTRGKMVQLFTFPRYCQQTCVCEHTSSPCQTFARLSSLGEIWIVSCHPCSGGEDGRGRGGGKRGEGREREVKGSEGKGEGEGSEGE